MHYTFSLHSGITVKMPSAYRFKFAELHWLLLTTLLPRATGGSSIPRLEVALSPSHSQWMWVMRDNGTDDYLRMLSGTAAEACIMIARMLSLDQSGEEGLVAQVSGDGTTRLDVVDRSKRTVIATFTSHLEVLQFFNLRARDRRKRAKRDASRVRPMGSSAGRLGQVLPAWPQTMKTSCSIPAAALPGSQIYFERGAATQTSRPPIRPSAALRRVNIGKFGASRENALIEPQTDEAEFNAGEMTHLSEPQREFLRAHESVTAPLVWAQGWRDDRRIFSVWDGTAERFPLFQIGTDGPLPVIADLLRIFENKLSPWQIACWLTTPNRLLDERRRPVDLLQSEPEKVLVAARQAVGPAVC